MPTLRIKLNHSFEISGTVRLKILLQKWVRISAILYLDFWLKYIYRSQKVRKYPTMLVIQNNIYCSHLSTIFLFQKWQRLASVLWKCEYSRCRDMNLGFCWTNKLYRSPHVEGTLLSKVSRFATVVDNVAAANLNFFHKGRRKWTTRLVHCRLLKRNMESSSANSSLNPLTTKKIKNCSPPPKKLLTAKWNNRS